MAKLSLNDAPIYPPLPTIEELQQVEIDKIDKIHAVKILAGFDYEFKGKTYHFSTELEDQQNVSLMTNSANMSVSLGNMSEADRKAAYGADLPVALPSEWKTVWQGHADGTSYSLEMSLPEFLAFAKACGDHITNELGTGWFEKDKIRATKTEAELKELVNELDLENRLREIRDLEDA